MGGKKENPADYYLHARPEMLEHIPAGVRKVLDVGCGAGSFGQAVKTRFQAEVWGIEVSKEAGRKAEEVLDRVLVGNIESGELPLPRGYFDCIVFNDVLEHLQNPWQALARLRDSLKDEGYVVASIPNVRFYRNMRDLVFRKKWEYTDAGLMDRTHLRFFTCSTMKDMFEKSGYEVVYIKGLKGKRNLWKLSVLNVLLFNLLDDMKYMQYACVARKKGQGMERKEA